MGASLLALTVPRYAVISEGPSDAILLPTLIKRALNLASLPYRVVPGLSEISAVHMPRLKSHAGDVVCLVDGDSGGRATTRSLTKNGIPATSVLSLQSIGTDAAIEDLVTADLFVETIDLETKTWGGTTPLRAADVPDFGRWAWLKKEHPAIERPLNKNRVAGRMADRIRLASQVADVIPDPLVPAIGALHQSILAALGVATVVDHETAGGEA
jgi:hypothetical protein